jgi:outer membrane protein assembly factor BamB
MHLIRLKSSCVFCVLVTIVLFVLVGVGRGEDWPTWRHDRLRTGVTAERLDPPLDRVWTFRSQQFSVAPKPTHRPDQAKYPWLMRYTLAITAAGDSLFFTSAHDGRAVCLDAASGKKRWEFVAGAAINRTATIWKHKVYVGSDDGYVYCLDAKTGAVVWKFKAAPTDRQFVAYGRPVSVWPVRTGVLVDAGVAYFGAGVFPHDGTFLYALDAVTGKVIWRNGTQSETAWRASMAPAGHLFATSKSIWVPRDCWGYFTNWGSLVSFDRATGRYPAVHGPSEDPEWPKQDGVFRPLYGVRKGNVRYDGMRAMTLEKQAQGRDKETQLWGQNIPGRWTDIDSAISVRYKRPTFFRFDPDLSSIVYAGGVLYHSAFETDPKKGVGSGVYARDPKDGKVLWSAEIAQRANQLIVANGRLFVATRRGTIHCFARKGSKAWGEITEPIEAQPFKTGGSMAQAARSIIKHTGVKAGYAIVLDCSSGQLAFELAKQTELYVVAVFDDATAAAAARRAYRKGGSHVSRIIAMHKAPGAKLALSSYFADLIVTESGVVGGALPKDKENLNRMLKPIRGVALIGGKQTAEVMKKWSGVAGQADLKWEIVNGDGFWARRVRPRLANAGGWYHAYADAGHTNCSRDAALKAPLGMLWYGTPHLGHGTGAPASSWIVDGILLIPQEDGSLAAYDQYTGRALWRRGHSRTDTVAGPGSVFLRYEELVVRLDPSTGKVLREYLPSVKDSKWHAMAASRDGKTLYLIAGGKDWRGMTALDAMSGKPRWSLGGPGQAMRWGRWGAIGDRFIYVLGDAAKTGPRRVEALAEMRTYLKKHNPKRLEKFEKELDQRDVRILTTLDANTGKILYERGVDITNCGGGFLPRPNYGSGRYAKHYNPHVGFCMIAQKDVVIFCTQSGADKGWGVWPRGGYKQRGIATHDGKSGKLLWNRLADYRTRPVVVDDTIYAEPWGYDLRTGQRRRRIHPITGEKAHWAWCRSDKQCGIFSASTNFLFGRSLGVGYQDLLGDNGLYTFYHSRMSCSFDAVSGGGMMIKPPNAVYCKCSWSLPFTIALGQVSTPPVVAQSFAQPGRSTPVKHLHLDFAASGDRRDKDGNLWIHPNHSPGHHLILGYGSTSVMYAGGRDVRRSSQYTPIENTDAPFVFASALVGVKRVILPVTTPADGAGVFKVKLGFAALPGDRAGRRVFDVRLNGKTVLKDFDIIKEAGKVDRALWKEFTLALDGDVTLDFVAKADKPAPDQMPLINGLVILREKVTTLGLDTPGDVWLNRSTRGKTLEVSVANLRNELFHGRIVFDAPKGVTVTAPQNGALTLQPGQRKTVTVQVTALDGIKAARHVVSMRLEAKGAATVVRKFTVEWLGPLHRAVLTGSDHPLVGEELRTDLSRLVKPAMHSKSFHVTRGSAGPRGARDAACILQFHVPEEYRGRIRAARLRMQASPGLGQARDAMATGRAWARAGRIVRSWGRLKQLKGPPWPDYNKIRLPDLPPVLVESSTLSPPGSVPTLIEGLIPGDLGHVMTTHHFRLLIEPTASAGPAYWGQRATNPAKRPVLLIDYEPKPKPKP